MLEEYTKYKASDLQQPVGIIHDLYLSRRGNSLEAVRNKYKQHKVKKKKINVTLIYNIDMMICYNNISRWLISDLLVLQFKCVATMPVSPELPQAFFEDVTIR